MKFKIPVFFGKARAARFDVLSHVLLKCPCGKRAHLQHIEMMGLCEPCFCVFASCKCGRATHGYVSTDDTMVLIENTVVTEWNEMNSNK